MEADMRKTEFVAMLAHELRNPLAPILYAVPILRRLGGNDERMANVVNVVERNVEVMSRLIEDLLDASRITSGKLALRKEIVSFQSVITNASETVSGQIKQKNQNIIVDLPKEPIVLIGDTIRLEQLFVNILHNATKYTPDSGLIKISTTLTDETIQIIISDTGVGIEFAYQNIIWEVFGQAHQSLDRTQGGLGLGLAVVKSLVELHGGSVSVNSNGNNQGSQFTVILPRLGVKMANNTIASNDSNSTVSQNNHGLSILLVDDNEDAAQSLCMYLEMCGHTVTVAYDGNKALDAAQSKEYQVILLDIGLPGVDGFEVCKTLRNKGCNSHIIAVTGYGMEEDKERSRQVGFNRHLTKPVNPDLIEQHLASLSR